MSDTHQSPVALLQSMATTLPNSPRLVLLTGEFSSGKTTWCLQLLEQARLRGMLTAGLVSPAVFEQGVKIGIDLMDIVSGERRRLAVRHSLSSGQAPQLGPLTQNWHFDSLVLAWGNQILENLSECELLILDELGPLEFLAEQGLTAALKLIDAKQYRLACVVVRVELLSMALERWPWGQPYNLTAFSVEGQ